MHGASNVVTCDAAPRHLQIPVADAAKSVQFYDTALAPLGYSRLYTDDANKTYCYGKYVTAVTYKSRSTTVL